MFSISPSPPTSSEGGLVEMVVRKRKKNFYVTGCIVFLSSCIKNKAGSFFVRFEKTQVRKKLRFSRKNSGFPEKTQVFVNF